MALLEQAAIAGALTPDPARATAAAQALAARLNAVSLPTERGWMVAPTQRADACRARCAAWRRRYTLDAAALRSAEARWLAERAEALAAPLRASRRR